MTKTRYLQSLLNEPVLTNGTVLHILRNILDIPSHQKISEYTNHLIEDIDESSQHLNQTIFTVIFLNGLLTTAMENELLSNPFAPTSPSFFNHLKNFLHAHWCSIKDAPELHYQYRSLFFINRVCMEIALLCAKGLKTPCATVLYPELKDPVVEHTLTTVVDETRLPDLPLVCSHFVLSDGGEYVIEIDDCLDRAKIDGVLRHSQKEEPLSESEKQRVLGNRYAAEFYQAIKDWRHCKYHTPTIGALIATLIAGMRDGGAYRLSLKHLTGAEDNAGMQANEVISFFINTITALPEATRNTLYPMRNGEMTFSELMKDISHENHEQQLSQQLATLNARTRMFHDKSLALTRFEKNLPALRNTIECSQLSDEAKQQQLAELDCQATVLLTELNHAEAALTPDDKKELEKFNKLAATPGKCVELSAAEWAAFLKKNHDQLYNMSLDHSAGVQEQLAILERRMHECQDDLNQYFVMLEEYLKAPKLHENFTPDCNKKSKDAMYGDLLYQWLTTGTEAQIISKIGTLTMITHARPQALFEISLFSKLPEPLLQLMVMHHGEAFLTPVLQAICSGRYPDNDNNFLISLLKEKDASLQRAKFFPNILLMGGERSNHLYSIITRIVRLLFVKPDCHLLAQDNGYMALCYAATMCMDELIKLLLSKGAHAINTHGSHAIYHAVKAQHIDSIKLLLPTVTQFYSNVLHAACDTRSNTIYQLVYSRFVSIEFNEEILAEAMFTYANETHNSHALSFALQKGARNLVNMVLDKSETPLLRFINPSDPHAPLTVQLLITAGADVDYVNPQTGCSVLMSALQKFLRHCLSNIRNENNSTAHTHAECQQQINESLRGARKIFASLLSSKLPETMVQEEVINNTLAWLLQTISLPCFEQSIDDASFSTDHTFCHLFYLADLMTDEQLYSIMRHHEKTMSAIILKMLGKAECSDWNTLLLDVIADTQHDLHYPAICLLLHHPKIKREDFAAAWRQAVKHGALGTVKKLFTTKDMTLTTLELVNEFYAHPVAAFLCEQLTAAEPTFTPDSLKELWTHFMRISLAHEDVELLERVMQHREYVDMNHFKDKEAGKTLLMQIAKYGDNPAILKALLPYVDEVEKNEKDGKTAYDYACERLAEDYVYLGSVGNHIYTSFRLFYDATSPVMLRSRHNLCASLEAVLHFSALMLDAPTRSTLSEKVEALKRNSRTAVALFDLIPELLIRALPLAPFQRLFQHVPSQPPTSNSFIDVFAKKISLMSEEQAKWFTATYLDCRYCLK